MRFEDHFSAHAAAYAAARPDYPPELYAWLAGLCRERECAWDCATGSGQAAAGLSAHFARVIATDASGEQLANARPLEGVSYHCANAEASGLAAASVDLVTVAQALHWFDRDAFFAETRRVLKPGGVLAVWCYGTCQTDEAIDRLVHGVYHALDPWWPPERALIDRGYADIELPHPLIDAPAFRMRAEWHAAQMLAYLDTWSATRRCRRETGRDPLAELGEALPAAWGDAPRTVYWPLFLKVCRYPG